MSSEYGGLLIIPQLRGQRQGVPKADCLGRLARLVSFPFKWETPPQSVRWQMVREDTQQQPLASAHIWTDVHTQAHPRVNVNVHTYTPHPIQQKERRWNGGLAGWQTYEDLGRGIWRASSHPVDHLGAPLLWPKVGASAFLPASGGHGFRVSSHGVFSKCRTPGPICISSLFCSPRCTIGHHLAPSPGGQCLPCFGSLY